MNELLTAEAILGRDAEEFQASELGRYLIGRAKQEEDEAMDGLADVDPADSKAVMTLQGKAWRARSFRLWLLELIDNGRQAEAQLDQQQAEQHLE